MYARLLTQLEEAADRARGRATVAYADDLESQGIRTTVALGHFHSEPLSAEEARIRQQIAALRRFAAQRAGGSRALAGDSDAVMFSVVGMYAAILVGIAATTAASYYLVRGVAPKKSANAYGGVAAASNLIFPLIGPLVVGIMAANAEGKR